MELKNLYITPAVLLLSSFLAFSSCKKDKETETETERQGEAVATATIKTENNTLNFSSAGDSAVAILAHATEEDQYLYSMILKDKSTGAIIEITILPANNGTGTYNVGEASQDSWTSATVLLKGRSSGRADKYNSVYLDINGKVTQSSGTLTVTSMTEDRVKGSFKLALHSFNPDTKAIKEMHITNGSFDLPLIRKDFSLDP